MSSTDDTDMIAEENRRLTALVSSLVERQGIAQAMGDSFGNMGTRDYFEALGYPSRSELDAADYRAQFERGGIAETIVTAVSGQTWSAAPQVTDDDGFNEDAENRTDFEQDVADVFDDTGALYYIERADTLQRIGRFGVLLIGFDDGRDLDQPVDQTKLAGDPTEDILYWQPFGETDIEGFDRVDDTTDERFGLPETYQIDFGDDGIGETEVHHERVVHLAEGALEDEAIGYSAYRPVFNLLLDLTKLVGGSAEMYWRDAKKRYVANLDPEAGNIPDVDELQTQVEEMVNDLRDVVRARGLDMEEIGGGTPDPSGPAEVVLNLLAGTLRIPKRRLLGTERGDLASSQDEAAFVSMIEERRQKFAEPQVLRPLVDKLVEFGVVAAPIGGTYDVEWPENFELTEVEKAEVKQRLAKAYKDAASMGDPAEVATVEERREAILDLPPERGAAVDPLPVPEDPEEDAPEDTDVEDTGVDDVGPDDELDEDDPNVEDWFDEEFGDDGELEGDGVEAVADGGVE